MSVTAHAANCKKQQVARDQTINLSTHDTHDTTQAAHKFPCPHEGCGKGPFSTQRGLGVHITAVHKVARDAEAMPTHSRVWSNDEVELLANEFRKLPHSAQTNSLRAAQELVKNPAFTDRRSIDALRRMVINSRFTTVLASLTAASQSRTHETHLVKSVRHEQTELQKPQSSREPISNKTQPVKLTRSTGLQTNEPPTTSSQTDVTRIAEDCSDYTFDTKHQQQQPAKPETEVNQRLLDVLNDLLRERSTSPTVDATNEYVQSALRNYDPNSGWDKFISNTSPHRQTSPQQTVPPTQPRLGRLRKQGQKQRTRKPAYTSGVERRTKFAEYQSAWQRNPRIVAQAVINDLPLKARPPSVNAIDEEFRTRFETVNLAVDEQEYAVKTDANKGQSIRPVDIKEVSETIKRLDASTAPGPDKDITARFIKQLPNGVFLRLWNLWLYLRRVPVTIKQSRTILLPKSADGHEDPANWRPITIASIWQRTFSSFLVRRLCLNLNKRQKAFTSGMDGVGEHVAVIKSVLREAASTNSPLDVVLLDVSKAFDNVSHSSLFRALKRLDVHPALQAIVVDSYTNAGTNICVGLEKTERILFKRGIRQGDPLSPLLFNAVLDELLDTLGSKFGVEIDGVKLNALAFADDLALLSGSSIGTQVLLSETKSFLDQRGMSVNVAKSTAMRMRPIKGRKWARMCVTEQEQIMYDGRPIPMSKSIDAAKYLGARLLPSGRTTMNLECISGILERLQKSPLRPLQKVEIIRTYIAPRLTYHMARADNVGSEALKDADRLIRKSVRLALHLHKATCTEAFSIGTASGGLGIPSLYYEVSAERVRITERLTRSSDAAVAAVGFTTHYQRQKAISLKRMDLEASPESAKGWILTKLMKQRALIEAYAKTASGRGADCVASSGVGRSWLHGHPPIHNARVCWAVKTLIGRLPTRANTVHDIEPRHPSRLCRRCGQWQEYASHVLQNCPATKGARINRHNFLVDLMASEVRKQRGTIVHHEPAIYTGPNTWFRPDLIVIREQCAWIIDAQVPYENQLDSLSKAASNKIAKYRPIERAVQEKYGVSEVQTRALVVGARGTWYRRNDDLFRELNITGNAKQRMALGALMGSVNVWFAFKGKA